MRCRHLLAGVGLVCAVVLLYAHTLHSPFMFDDDPNIQGNPALRLHALTFAGFKKVIVSSIAPNRPIANLSFALNYYVHRYHVVGYHVVNILVHITTGLLLYAFVRLTLRTPALQSRYAHPESIAFFTALLWLMHPIQTQSVTYIVQRMNSMAGMFYMLSLVLYARARLSQDTEKQWPWLTGCVLAGLLALGSKEIAATLPCCIALYEWYFFQELRPAWLKRYSFLAVGMLLFLTLLAFLYIGTHPLDSLLATYDTRDFTLSERVLTELRVVMFYLRLLAFPHPSQLTLEHDFPLSYSVLDPITTLMSLAAIVGMLGVAVYLARQERLLSFCLLWFFGHLALESSVIGLEIVFEHRTYLPSMMLIFLAVTLVYRWLKATWYSVAVLCLVAGVYATWTYERNLVWADEVTFWSDAVQKAPHKARPHISLGVALDQQGKSAEAIAHYTAALRLEPASLKAHNNLGLALARQGQVPEAIAHYTEALRLRPTFAEARANLGVALLRQNNVTEAMAHLREALRLKPTLVEAHNNLAAILARQGQLQEAITHYTAALRLQPTYVEAHYNLGIALEREGQHAQALTHYAAVLRLQPTFTPAYYRLGKVLEEQGRQTEAMAAYRAALRARPGWPLAAHQLARLLATQASPASHDIAEAVYLAEAACQAPENRQAACLDTLAIVYATAGRRDDAIQTARQAITLAAATGDTALVRQLQAWLERYTTDGSSSAAP